MTKVAASKERVKAFFSNMMDKQQENSVLCKKFGGVQRLSGRVLDSRPRGCGFEPHQRHCVMVLEQDTFILT